MRVGGVGDGAGGELGGEFLGSGVRPVVGDDFVYGYPDGAEPLPGALEEPAESVGGLVVEGLDISEAGMVVHAQTANRAWIRVDPEVRCNGEAGGGLLVGCIGPCCARRYGCIAPSASAVSGPHRP